MTKEIDIDSRQNIFQIYLSTYKKYKYWFTVFYFLSIVFSLLIYNEGISEKIEQYKSMKHFLSEIKHIEFFSDLGNQFNSINIVKELKNKFKYKKISDGNWNQGQLQNKSRQYKTISKYANSLNLYTSSIFETFTDSVMLLVNRDSIMIEDTISYYHVLINQDSIYKDDNIEWSKYRRNIRNRFVKSINKSFKRKYMELLPLDSISSYVLNRYLIPDSTFKKLTISNMKEKSIAIVNEVESWEKEDIIDPQNFRVPLSFGKIKIYSLLIIVIVAIFLQFHYLNFKFYEKEFLNTKQKYMKVPAINNIIENLKIPFLSYGYITKLIKLLSYVFNLILPVIIIYVIGKQIWNLLYDYTWFYIAIIIYIIGFLSILMYVWKDEKISILVKNKFVIWKNKLFKFKK